MRLTDAGSDSHHKQNSLTIMASKCNVDIVSEILMHYMAKSSMSRKYLMNRKEQTSVMYLGRYSLLVYFQTQYSHGEICRDSDCSIGEMI